jgi:tripartite-type tricarboxylate transporter receptor subunit TctC
MLAWLKANPNRGTAATVGAESAAHLCGIYLQNATVTEFQFVPYRGSGIASRVLEAICSRQRAAATYASDSLVALSVARPEVPPSDHGNH